MKRLFFILVLGLGAALPGLSDAVLAQAPVVYDDASGTNGTNGACTVEGPPSDQMVVCRDLRPGQGRAVTEDGAKAKEPTPVPEPAPDTEAAPETTDAAVASATDQDADNYPDAQELDAGLDPSNADTDADNVADGDEINIYGTDPLNPDSDGDGVSDGAELFANHTDPAVWDDFNGGGTGSTAETP